MKYNQQYVRVCLRRAPPPHRYAAAALAAVLDLEPPTCDGGGVGGDDAASAGGSAASSQASQSSPAVPLPESAMAMLGFDEGDGSGAAGATTVVVARDGKISSHRALCATARAAIYDARGDPRSALVALKSSGSGGGAGGAGPARRTRIAAVRIRRLIADRLAQLLSVLSRCAAQSLHTHCHQARSFM